MLQYNQIDQTLLSINLAVQNDNMGNAQYYYDTNNPNNRFNQQQAIVISEHQSAYQYYANQQQQQQQHMGVGPTLNQSSIVAPLGHASTNTSTPTTVLVDDRYANHTEPEVVVPNTVMNTSVVQSNTCIESKPANGNEFKPLVDSYVICDKIDNGTTYYYELKGVSMESFDPSTVNHLSNEDGEIDTVKDTLTASMNYTQTGVDLQVAAISTNRKFVTNRITLLEPLVTPTEMKDTYYLMLEKSESFTDFLSLLDQLTHKAITNSKSTTLAYLRQLDERMTKYVQYINDNITGVGGKLDSAVEDFKDILSGYATRYPAEKGRLFVDSINKYYDGLKESTKNNDNIVATYTDTDVVCLTYIPTDLVMVYSNDTQLNDILSGMKDTMSITDMSHILLHSLLSNVWETYNNPVHVVLMCSKCTFMVNKTRDGYTISKP